ncbi:hypothetical protein RFI_34973 [Reticulomyxa filosa]|uniref:Uncharacterized protein n=1 Tax=Reticulomyxa filosa TaxID=46433 RepID=X6LKJ9_RETFI|nr:hypothetical protein RFI_34973 [Reticulomyxa filosa]|eukprot:ETO02458.1 hypothetical protein RFI_34973 [Reticulomyxa filosa]
MHRQRYDQFGRVMILCRHNEAAYVKDKNQTEQNVVSTTPTNSNQQVSQTQVTLDNNMSTASAIERDNHEMTAVSYQQSTKLSPFVNSYNRVPSYNLPTLIVMECKRNMNDQTMLRMKSWKDNNKIKTETKIKTKTKTKIKCKTKIKTKAKIKTILILFYFFIFIFLFFFIYKVYGRSPL